MLAPLRSDNHEACKRCYHNRNYVKVQSIGMHVDEST